MTTPNQILVDLLAGQSSADSIAGRLRVPALVIEAMLKRHSKDGLTYSGMIAERITVWSLTTEGRITANQLKTDRPRRGQSSMPASPI